MSIAHVLGAGNLARHSADFVAADYVVAVDSEFTVLPFGLSSNPGFAAGRSSEFLPESEMTGKGCTPASDEPLPRSPPGR